MFYIGFCATNSSSLSSISFTKFNVITRSAQIWRIHDFSNNAAARHHMKILVLGTHCVTRLPLYNFTDARHLNITRHLKITRHLILARHLIFTRHLKITRHLILTRHLIFTRLLKIFCSASTNMLGSF